MKYALCLVLDQDIRQYEKFSQVCIFILLALQSTVTDIRFQNLQQYCGCRNNFQFPDGDLAAPTSW